MLCRLLRELRESAGLNQEEVAKAVGRPQSFVSKYEAGERRLDVLELRELCGALGTDLPEFVKNFERKLGG